MDFPLLTSTKKKKMFGFFSGEKSFTNCNGFFLKKKKQETNCIIRFPHIKKKLLTHISGRNFTANCNGEKKNDCKISGDKSATNFLRNLNFF